MKIIINHYEKFLLGIALIGLAFGFTKAMSNLEVTKEEYKYPPLKGQIVQVMELPDVDHTKVSKIADGTIFKPAQHIHCRGCTRIIKQTRPMCFFCKFDNREKGKGDIIADNDFDDDGIPNDAEKRAGLDPTNKDDALLDFDKDGFCNLFEFHNETGIDSKDEHPELCFHLVFVSAKRKTLPIKLKSVNNTGDKKDWTAQIRNGKRSLQLKIGEKVSNMTITDIVYDIDYGKERVIDKSYIMLKSETGDVFKAGIEKSVKTKFKVYTFKDKLNNKTIEVKEGQSIKITGKNKESVAYHFEIDKDGHPIIEGEEEKIRIPKKRSLYESKLEKLRK